MSVEVRVIVADQTDAQRFIALNRKSLDGKIDIAIGAANGQQLSVLVDPVELFHAVRALYPDVTIQ